MTLNFLIYKLHTTITQQEKIEKKTQKLIFKNKSKKHLICQQSDNKNFNKNT